MRAVRNAIPDFIFAADGVTFRLTLALVLWSAVAIAAPDRLPVDPGQCPPLAGELALDISAAALWNGQLVLGPDEEHAVYLFEVSGGRHTCVQPVQLLDGPGGEPEVDIEAMAVDGPVLWVTGSHSAVRRKIDKSRSRDENRRRFTEIRDEPARSQVFALERTAGGQMLRTDWAIHPTCLRRNPWLSRAGGVPSKEGGVDIEGLAVRDGALYFGLRGPILRGGYAVVLRVARPGGGSADDRYTPPCDLDATRFVDLGGLGVRDLVTVDTGFLVIAGPMGDRPGPYAIHHWFGADCTPDRRVAVCAPRLLALPDAVGRGKPEGLLVLGSGPDGWRVAVFEDGAPLRGNGRIYRVPRPRSRSNIAE